MLGGGIFGGGMFGGGMFGGGMFGGGMFGGMGIPQSAPPSEAPSAPTGGNNATLNEVVGSLDMLNKQMAQLLSQHDEIGRLQVRATKSTSGNRLAA
jgi:hypothetical protein